MITGLQLNQRNNRIFVYGVKLCEYCIGKGPQIRHILSFGPILVAIVTNIDKCTKKAIVQYINNDQKAYHH